MAIPGYVPQTFTEGQELCTEDALRMSRNLDVIRNHSLKNSRYMTCQEISGTIDEIGGCLSVEPTSTNETLSANDVTDKIVTFTYTSDIYLTINNPFDNLPGGFSTGLPDQFVVRAPDDYPTRIIIRCGDVEVFDSGFTQCANGTPVSTLIRCPSDQPLVFCHEVFLQDLDEGSVRVFAINTVICGAVLSVNQRGQLFDRFFPTPRFDPDCCYGRNMLELVKHNANVLQLDFKSNTHQMAEFNDETINGLGSAPMFQNIEREAYYLIVGQITGTVRFGVPTFSVFGLDTEGEQPVEIQPFVGCQGSLNQCPASIVNVPGDLTPVDVSIPVVACGRCGEGDTVFAGLTQELTCNGLASVAADIQADLTQNYCGWKFERLPVDDLTDPVTGSIGSCLTVGHAQELADVIDGLHEFACTIEEDTFRSFSPELPASYDLTGGAYSETIELIPAQDEAVNAISTFVFFVKRAPDYPAGAGIFRVTLRCSDGTVIYSATVTTLKCASYSGCISCPAGESVSLDIEFISGDAIVYQASPVRFFAFSF